jgi:diguanylate cyclase (GGDEF)-like protein
MPSADARQQRDLIREDHGLIGRIAAIGAAFGSLGVGALWIVEPGRIESTAAAIVAISAWGTLSLAALFAPWDRFSRRSLMVPVFAGVILTALTCWNTGGGDSPFAFFYLYLAAMGAYFATRRQTLFTAGAVSAAAYLPVLYDTNAGLVDLVFAWSLITAMSTALSLLLQYQQDRVRRAAEQAEALALEDPLTGIPNRRSFEQRAAAELSRSRRHGLRFSLVYVDLDGFKRVNDTAGHAAGDEVLQRVAAEIAVAIRAEDFVARLGGDEFAVMLPRTGPAEARLVASRIVAAIETAAAGDDRLAGLSASFGLSTYPDDAEALEELLDIADVELMQVKDERETPAHQAVS